MNLGIPELMDHIKLPVILLTKLTAHHSTQHVMQKDKWSHSTGVTQTRPVEGQNRLLKYTPTFCHATFMCGYISYLQFLYFW